MNEIKVGDIITGYHNGYWEVYDIWGQLVYYRSLTDSNGKPRKGIKKFCNIHYCKKVTPDTVTEQYLEEKVKLLEKWSKIYKLVGGA